MGRVPCNVWHTPHLLIMTRISVKFPYLQNGNERCYDKFYTSLIMSVLTTTGAFSPMYGIARIVL